jgi:hypothetical protein
MKTILIDCDGVCLDWEEAFLVWMQHKGYTPAADYKQRYSIDRWFDFDKAKGKTMVMEFNASAAMGFLPPLRDAQHYIKKLAEKDQYKFVAVTSMSSDPFAQKLRIQNLKKLFGRETFTEFHILGCGDDKDDILSELSSKYKSAYWVEDKIKNAEVGMSFGLKPLLMEHGHNMDYNGPATLVKDWEEIYSIITEKWRK